ncbi:unnamed protein product [Cladocopium goreaui]|uniref:Uncharacterized protein n=1 Tax=Cladocopium goreaui TaxID=2562237 RepID=A0A9P1CW09_9DINO|nr:unnamed protein product [Cladocopium goreaui]
MRVSQHSRWAHGQLEAWKHFPPAVQLCLLHQLVHELAKQLDSWQIPFLAATPPDLLAVLVASCTAGGKKHGDEKNRTRPRSKIWRRRSDRRSAGVVEAEDQSSDSTTPADRTVMVALRRAPSALQRADAHQVQPHGDSKGALMEVDGMPQPIGEDEFRHLLREWYPDKNPEKKDMATSIFQFLQQQKTFLNLR